MGGGERRGRARQDVIDQPDPLGADRVDVLARQGELPQVAVPDDGRQALQAAHVSDYADFHLSHAEHRLGARVADVASGQQVNPAADAPAADRGRDGLAAVRDRGKRILQGAQLVQHAGAAMGETDVGAVRPDDPLEHGPQIQAVAEVVPGPGEDHGANAVVSVQRGEHYRDLAPELRTHRITPAGAQQGDLDHWATPLEPH